MDPLDFISGCLVGAAVTLLVLSFQRQKKSSKYDETKGILWARVTGLANIVAELKAQQGVEKAYTKDLNKQIDDLRMGVDDLRAKTAARWESQMRKTLQLEDRIAELEEKK